MANEKRLIDANALIGHLARCKAECKGIFGSVCMAIKCFVEQMPTVDAVEVVRCKDCKWRNTKGCPYMNFNSSAREDFDFCSDGERESGGGRNGI